MGIRLALLVLLASLALFAAAQSPADESERKMADKSAANIAANDSNAVYEEMSPKVRKAYKRNELVAPLALMQAAYGRIVDFKLKATESGFRLVAGESIQTTVYWYAVATEKYPTGRFLRIEITAERGRYYLAGYSVLQFLDGQIPPFLK